MSLVYELEILMPVGMHAFEDTESVWLHCLWCGDEIRYTRNGPSADHLVADARQHRERCQTRRYAVESIGRLDD